MNSRYLFLSLAFLSLALLQPGMGSRGGYDEEAREIEKANPRKQEGLRRSDQGPLRTMAGGVKEATVDSAAEMISETADGTREDAPVVGTLEGARVGSGRVLDRTVKGVVKVATLGYGEVDQYEVQEPEAGTDKPTKITIKLPGT